MFVVEAENVKLKTDQKIADYIASLNEGMSGFCFPGQFEDF